PRQGATTSDNDRFLRVWTEVSKLKIGFMFNNKQDAALSGLKWFPYNKGGEFRRWYGNQDYLINYKNDGEEIKEFHEELNKIRPGGRLKNQEYYFQPCVSWSKISTGSFAARYFPAGFIFDVAGSAVFFKSESLCLVFSALLNTNFTKEVLKALSPTLNFEAEHLCRIPVLEQSALENMRSVIDAQAGKIVALSKYDWDSYETSWNFTNLPLVNPGYRQSTLKATYQKLRAHWRGMTLEMQRLEQENNRIFIDAYGLQDELNEKVELNEITLTCNPHYRYSNGKSEEELEALLLADTLRELVSYAVGCMFGRYALDKPGLILANQGETIADYLKQIPEPSFPADDDNVIPMLDGDWFTDDITERFRQFLRVAFGEEHYEENLKFVEQALNVKGKREYSIRDYFLGEFYTDHVKRYKKRPIYWLFSSPKGSFNALIYMHRYQPHTSGTVLEYLRDFKDEKLKAHKNHLEAVSISGSASQAEKTKALKDIEKIKKIIAELEEYEREVLYPLATKQEVIDLDNGVKVNYQKFGEALKKIPGLVAKDEE
ncbi:MAG: BREX-1 system adenine-specific DNA-methyltransferase PglX, partial [Methylobacter sp.]